MGPLRRIARLPKGWTGDEPVRPRAMMESLPVKVQGSPNGGCEAACLCFFRQLR